MHINGDSPKAGKRNDLFATGSHTFRRRLAALATASALAASVLGFLGFTAGPAAASTIYYVAPGGATTGTCPSTSACTLDYALSLVASGDYVYMASGDYVSGTGSTGVGGTMPIALSLAGTINIQAQPGDLTAPILDGGNTNQVMTVASGTTLNLSGVDVENGSTAGGGAIYNSGTVTVTDSTFSGNSATGGAGGAILNNGTATVTDSTFSGNSAPLGGNGGAIFNNGPATITNSTFSSNSAGIGPDIYNGATLTVAANVFGDGCTYFSLPTDNGYNAGVDPSCENAGTGDSSAMTAAELGSLASNGGPTQTIALLASNPAIGMIPAGTGTYCPAGGKVDQRGDSSPSGAACDAGAVQFAPLYVIQSGGATAGTCPSTSACTLDFALSLATGSGYTILMAAGDYTSAAVGASGMPISISLIGGLTISAESGAAVFLDGGNTNQVMTVAGTSSLNLSGVDVENGSTGGGGAIVNFGTVTVTDSTFSGNSTSAADGGAIFNNGTVTVTDSTFSSNSATGGDGGAIFNHGTATITSSTFSSNSASTADGGAIFNFGTATITNSTFSGNSAADGGAIFNNGTATITSSTFSSNSASFGPDIYNFNTLTVAANVFGDSCAGTLPTDNGHNAGVDTSCENAGTGDSSAMTAAELGSLASNGGPTQTIALLASNPAIGLIPTSTPPYCPAGGIVADQRGYSSPSGAACDAGAVQLVGQVVAFTTTAPTSPTVGSSSYTPAATGGGSGNPVVISLDASSSGCSLSGGVVSFPSAGTCVIDANQAGNTNFTAAAQVQQSFVVSSPQSSSTATTTTVSVSPNPAAFGQSVTLTATVSGGGTSPGGSVTFYDGQAALGLASLNGDTATFSTSTLSNGTHSITANYSGYGSIGASMGGPVSLVVGSTTPPTTTPPTTTPPTTTPPTTTPPTTTPPTTTPPTGTCPTGETGTPPNCTTPSTGKLGYIVVTSTGGVSPFGSIPNAGSVPSTGDKTTGPVVAATTTANDQGYWLASAQGGVYTFGDAGFYGAADTVPLAKPVLGISGTPDSKGYWLVASDGGVFAYGDAGFFGNPMELNPSLPPGPSNSVSLDAPVVGIAPTHDGKGYFEVGSDGGVFAFGDAVFAGSAAPAHPTSPVVGIALSKGNGYWEVSANGQVFAFGSAGILGGASNLPLNGAIVAIQATPDGAGYWLFGADGGVFAFGDAQFDGSAVGTTGGTPAV